MAAGTWCDQRQAGSAQEHIWLSLPARSKQMSDVQGRKVLMHEEARLKYIHITISASEYANCIPLGRRNGKVCTWGALLVLQPLAAVLSMQLDRESFSEVVPSLNWGLYARLIFSASYFALQTCFCSAVLLTHACIVLVKSLGPNYEKHVEYRMLNVKHEEFLCGHFHNPHATFVDTLN